MNKEELWRRVSEGGRDYERRHMITRENAAKFDRLLSLIGRPGPRVYSGLLQLDISEGGKEKLSAMLIRGDESRAIEYYKDAPHREFLFSEVGIGSICGTGMASEHAESLDMLEQAAADPEINPELARKLTEAKEET